jgi:DNA-binding CsgD family transcriptional regulator
MPPSRALPAKAEQALRKERRARAVELRIAGMSPHEIAERLGYHVNSVHADLRGALATPAQRTTEELEQLREIEIRRLDRLQVPFFYKALEGDAEALAAVLKVMERRARLLGLDAPTKQHVVHTDVDAWRNSEEWQATVAAILEAARPHPLAGAAIFEAIERLRLGHELTHGSPDVIEAEVVEEAQPNG